MEWADPHCKAMAAKTKNELKKNDTFSKENPQVSLNHHLRQMNSSTLDKSISKTMHHENMPI